MATSQQTNENTVADDASENLELQEATSEEYLDGIDSQEQTEEVSPESATPPPPLVEHDKPTSQANPSLELIQSKLNELENKRAKEDEEKRLLAKQVKKEAKEVMQSLDSYSTKDEKIDALHKKYTALLHDFKKLEKDLQLKKLETERVTKERDATRTELKKTKALKTKIENLSRELQKQNRLAKEESKRIATEEQQKRQELTDKFQTAIDDISNRMKEDNEKKQLQQKQNDELRVKLQNFLEQYELREEHFSKILKAKELEYQLSEAKLMQHTAMRNESLRREQELRNEIAVYGERFEQFQDTLSKSNEVFDTFKKEIEKMTKTIKKYEKENVALKAKSDQLNRNLLDMAEEQARSNQEKANLQAKLTRLENLCRALQKRKGGAGDTNEMNSDPTLGSEDQATSAEVIPSVPVSGKVQT
eukprot:Colp12_sorted_trinity150504_noHs@2509